ncbi:SPOR domain-containing protein [Oceanisphaera avium]|uniref:SPOR domain-containing protein n=1 Tax=Oceanisphaera avium TaxID=1903694 RepID=UPI001E3BD0F2|nr:SPOR domain-containing protein [Oceanisphaera avium]
MKINDYRYLLEQKSVKALLTILIVVVLLIVIVSLTPGTDKPEQLPATPEQVNTLPNAVPNQPAITAEPNSETPANTEDVVQDWPAVALPESPTIAATDTQTLDDSDKERVVIEDDVVSQLMERESDASAAVPAPPAPKAPAPSKEHAQPVAPKASPKAATAAHLGSVENLKQRSAQRYTLQLLAGRNKAVLEALVSQHKLDPAWIYPRTIDGQPWFILVQGDYVSAKHARDAIKDFAPEIQAAKPWPKPFGQVQKEIQP